MVSGHEGDALKWVKESGADHESSVAAEAEPRLANAIGKLYPCLEEFNHLCISRNLMLDVAVERSVLAVRRVLTDQVRRWGWQFLFEPNGRGEVRRRAEDHKRAREMPFLRACLT